MQFKFYGPAFNDMLNMPEVQAEVEKHAEGIATRARANAPVQSGAYQDSIHVEQTNSREQGWTELSPRGMYTVVADAAHASRVEASHRPIGRAAFNS